MKNKADASHREATYRTQQVRPQTVDLKLFDCDEDYRTYIFLRGKDMICFDEIGLSALAQLVMNRLESARSAFPQSQKSKTFEQAVTSPYGHLKTKELKLPNGLKVEDMCVYFVFGPREFNPPITPPAPRGFKRYERMSVVGSNAGLHVWLPRSNELVVLDLELMEYFLKKDRMIGWYCLHGIKHVFTRLIHDFNMILTNLVLFNDETHAVLGRIRIR